MNTVRLSEAQKNTIINILDQYPVLRTIIDQIIQQGGRALLVGGAVRDLLLNLQIKDLDIEVHGLSADQLEKILAQFGIVDKVGKVFGVLRIHGLNIDWSLPRSDATGRKPQVVIDPHMSIKQAFERRDLTINAMGIDLKTYELIDPFNGYSDLQNHVLRSPNPSFFTEDPLRFFRVMQFVARFNMWPDDELNKLCSTMDISAVSRERIEEECKKWLLRSQKPSLALNWLEAIGRLSEIFPEIAALHDVPQSPVWHPEGDVYEHSKQAIDAAARFEYKSDDEKLIIMYAALCHDLGKATTTEKKKGRWISYGHAMESARLAKQLLKRITNNHALIDAICTLVHYHMHPLLFITAHAKPPAYKRLARKLSPLNIRQLSLLAIADRQGRNPKKGEPLTEIDKQIELFIQTAERAKVLDTIEQPILHGRDFIDIVKPGPDLGKLVKLAYQLQIEHGITDKQQLKKLVLEKYRT